MRILIQNTYPETPHFETELEIALNHLKNGHEVYFLPYIHQFKHCFYNPENTFYRKLLARNVFDNGLKLLKSVAPKNASISVLNYPEVHIPDNIFPGAADIDDLKKITYRGIDLGLATASSIISYKREHKLNIYKNETLIANAYYTAVFVYESTKLLMQRLKFDKVVLFNGRFVENRPLLRICQENNINYSTHERAGVLQHYLVRENDIPHSIETASKEIDKIWETGSIDKRKVGMDFFINRRARVQQGWHSYTTSQEPGILPAGFDRSKRNIAIFNSSIDECEGIDGYSNPIYKDENVAITQICDDLKDQTDLRIYLRVHPNLKGLRNSQIIELYNLKNKTSNLVIVEAGEKVDSYSLMEAADVVLTFGSTTGIEAAFCGKPVVFAGKSFAENLRCFHKPSSHQELMKFILNRELKPLDKEEAIKYGYWELSYGTSFKYYQPASVTTGLFLETQVGPTGIFKFLKQTKNFIRNIR